MYTWFNEVATWLLDELRAHVGTLGEDVLLADALTLDPALWGWMSSTWHADRRTSFVMAFAS